MADQPDKRGLSREESAGTSDVSTSKFEPVVLDGRIADRNGAHRRVANSGTFVSSIAYF